MASSIVPIVGMVCRSTRRSARIRVSITVAIARNSADDSGNRSDSNDHEDTNAQDMSNHPVALLARGWRLEALEMRVRLLKRAVNWLIYASVILGVALVAQLYALRVPSWLLYSILAGWALYLIVAIEVATGHNKAYPPALVLSIVTLVVSLPQPEHYSLADTGPTLASLTFISGSLLQVGVIILTTVFLLLRRRQSLRGDIAAER